MKKALKVVLVGVLAVGMVFGVGSVNSVSAEQVPPTYSRITP